MDSAIHSSLELLAAWTEGERNRLNLPGTAVGFILDQELAWFRSFGVADLKSDIPFEQDTRFRIASISKLFTATAVMQLRDLGRIELDAPVVDYLPWFKVRQTFQTARAITVRQLLLHTAGLPRESGVTYWDDPEKFPSLEELKGKLPLLETVFAPDMQFKYSNLGIALAGEIVAACSGQPFETFLGDNILRPLGMQNTIVFPAADTPNLASGYLRQQIAFPRENAPFTNCRALAPAANLCSTIADLSRFFGFHFSTSESTILSLESRQEMHRAHWIDHDWKSARGLGFRLRRINELTSIGHEGWVTGYRSFAGFIAEQRFGFVVFVNADDISPYHFYSRAVQLLSPAVARLRESQASIRKLQNPERFCGQYRSRWEDSAVVADNGRLYLVFLSEADPVQSRFWLEPESDTVFRVRGTDGSPPIGERATFEFDGKAVAQRLRFGDLITYRL